MPRRAGRSAPYALRGLALTACGLLACAALALGAADEAGPDAEPRESWSEAHAAVAGDPAAALRVGRDALTEGAPDAAARIFAKIAEAHPLVADHAARQRLRALAAAERHGAVRRDAAAFLAAHPEAPPYLRADVWRLRAEAAAAEGDGAAARAAWQEAKALAPDSRARAEASAAIARSLEADGAHEAAAVAWRTLYTELAATPAAEPAEEALVRLEKALGRRLRTGEVHAERARVLYEARRNPGALEAAEGALASADLSADVREELARLRAFTLFRLRRYPQAVRAFQALGDDEEARLYHARSLARSGEIEASVRAFEALGARPERALGARALFLAATLLEDEDAEARRRARAHYATVAERAPGAEQRATARWRLGWLAWREGDVAAAAPAFAAAAELERDALEALRPRYWHARALEALGRRDAAHALYREIAGGHPFTYYGLRAEARLASPNGDGAGLGPPGAELDAVASANGAGPAAPAAGPAADPGPLTLDGPDLARARILLGASLREEAQQELPALVRRIRSDADLLTLGALLVEAGDAHTAQQLALDGRWERLARGPEPGRERLWKLAWPRAFADAVEVPARRHGVDPALVYAVMREESGYRPRVISPVGARGLVQIMPDTGARLARRLGWQGFDPARLLEPEPNLELGTSYLAELLERFRGRRSAAIAAYNAGPSAVSGWLHARRGLPDDAWVEAIPYSQTRQYVRRVLRSWHVYRVLH